MRVLEMGYFQLILYQYIWSYWTDNSNILDLKSSNVLCELHIRLL